MKIKGDSIERVVPIIGFLFLGIAAVSSFFIKGDSRSILAKIVNPQIVVSTVHILCTVICAIQIVKPSYFIMLVVLMLESLLTVITNYTQLGIFLFYACIFVIVIKDLYPEHRKQIIISFIIAHIVSLILTYTHGIPSLLVNVFSSAFYLVFFLWFFTIIREKASCHFSKNITQNEILGDRRQGDVIKLSDFKLSERQILFLLDNLYGNLSFKDLSEKHFVSLSTVKNDFARLYKVFCVSNLEELRILLLQYQVES